MNEGAKPRRSFPVECDSLISPDNFQTPDNSQTPDNYHLHVGRLCKVKNRL